MIKVVYCLRRRGDLTPEEFGRYWREIHAPLVLSHSQALGIRRYVQVHTDHGELTQRLAGVRGCGQPFDGVAEIWYESREALAAAGQTPEGRSALRALVEDERRFVDLAGSAIWIGDEVEIVAHRG